MKFNAKFETRITEYETYFEFMVFLGPKLFLMDSGDNKGLSTGGVAAPR
jgi:hypothetical protein